MNEDVLLEIKLALQGLQLTQQQILEKVNDVKSDHKELKDRVGEIETKINYAAGIAVPIIAFIVISVEWIRVKVLGS